MHPDACLASTCVLSGGLRFARPVRPQRQMHRMQTNIFADENWPPIFYWLLDTTIINSYLLTQRLSPPYQYQGSSRTFHLLLAESLFKLYGQKHKKPRKSYYTRMTTTLRYSKQQQTTKLPFPTGTQAQHQFIRIGDSKVSCVQCRFILRNMKRKGERVPLTYYEYKEPGCSFSFCKDCYNTRHAGLPIS